MILSKIKVTKWRCRNFFILKGYNARRFYSDTFAMIFFTTFVGMGVEIYISGLSFIQSFQTRVTAVPVNLITARPYGVFRDWFISKLNANKKGQILKAFADIFAFVLFQVPVYAIILFFSGANGKQIIIACSTLAFLSFVMGRPYGLFLNFSRWLFKVKSF